MTSDDTLTSPAPAVLDALREALVGGGLAVDSDRTAGTGTRYITVSDDEGETAVIRIADHGECYPPSRVRQISISPDEMTLEQAAALLARGVTAIPVAEPREKTAEERQWERERRDEQKKLRERTAANAAELAARFTADDLAEIRRLGIGKTAARALAARFGVGTGRMLNAIKLARKEGRFND